MSFSSGADPAMFPRERPSLVLSGFEILEQLGRGAVGEVFLARSRSGKLVAVKTVAQGLRDDRSSADAFAREASVCARLRHSCIVQVRAFLEDAEGCGVGALVFEYVPGVALARVLRLAGARGVRLPDRAGWYVVERVLTALAYAHAFLDESGRPTPIVHRDLSPANVLIGWNGEVKIADFGIAKVLGVSPTTRFGLVKGTPGCMAPEQARGEPVDERADVYAAALLAWRLATGRFPFGRASDEFELLRAMRNPRIKPLAALRPELPEPLLSAIARALEPEPSRRLILAAELAEMVRTHTDAMSGRQELETLLRAWRPALVSAVKRHGEADSSRDSVRVESTTRYDALALAFDDASSPDAPTLEAHALPSAPWPVASVSATEPADGGGQEREAGDASSKVNAVDPAEAEYALRRAVLPDRGVGDLAAHTQEEAPDHGSTRFAPRSPIASASVRRRRPVWAIVLAVVAILACAAARVLFAAAHSWAR
jgi:serine/threonine protein kinase